MKKPCRIDNIPAFYALLAKGPISGVLLLDGPLRSSHEFSLENGKVVDDSMVDGSRTTYTKHQFQKSIYAKAIERGALWSE